MAPISQKILASAGASVIIGARRQDALASVTAEITALGGVCETVSLDVTRADSIAAIAPALEQVDILVNNAGLVRDGSALDQSEDDWDTVIDTNLKGMFLMSQAVGRAMRKRGTGGSIINIASILGLRQAGGVLPYAVSKSGAIQMTKTLALELARYDIRVNVLAPGYVATELNEEFWRSDAGKAMINRVPQRRLGQLEDLQGPLLLLASDLSAYTSRSKKPRCSDIIASIALPHHGIRKLPKTRGVNQGVPVFSKGKDGHFEFR